MLRRLEKAKFLACAMMVMIIAMIASYDDDDEG